MENPDRYDIQLIDLLKQNGRASVTELARKIGLSNTPCKLRIKRLEQQGYIRGYTALIDHEKLGLNHIAFVQVSLSDTSSKSLAAFNRAVRAIPQVEQCHMIAGSFDYLLKVRTEDIKTYRYILGEQISALPLVQQTSTFVVMESVKEAGL